MINPMVTCSNRCDDAILKHIFCSAFLCVTATSPSCVGMGNSFSSSSSRPSSPAPVKYTYNTASARFTAKNDPKTMSTTKYGHVHVDVVSMTMYMMLVQPSMEMHWKMVSHAHAMLSKLLNPKLGKSCLRCWTQYWPAGHALPAPASPRSGYEFHRGPLHRTSPSSPPWYTQVGAAGMTQLVSQPVYPASSCKPHDSHPAAGLPRMAHRCEVLDMNSWTPMMPKMKNAKKTRIKTSKSMGRDLSKVTTSCRMPLTPVIVRNGLRIRTVLIPE
mmetsp:Transcript_6084/g.27299  ORF Transcript_6084/g.27299 Transcript_6084/m.27299 type:complete len:272 (+) Transcript_6084:694-1509(+)